MQIERAIDQVHAEYPECFLLTDVLFIQQPDVNDDVGGLLAQLRVKPNAQPSMSFFLAAEAVGGDGVGKNKKRALVAAGLIEPQQQEVKLVLQHALQALPADVALGWTINRIADRHVIS